MGNSFKVFNYFFDLRYPDLSEVTAGHFGKQTILPAYFYRLNMGEIPRHGKESIIHSWDPPFFKGGGAQLCNDN